MQILDRIVSKVGRRIDETSPMCDARLPDGSRVNAIIPPLALDGPAVTIRRFGANPLTLEDLLRFGAFTPEMVMLLEGAIKARLNMIVSGGTGSGKTTLLNTLSSFIPADQRIITIEDAAELQLQQEHVLRLETRPSNIEGKGRDHGDRPGPQRPAYAARPDHHRRVPWSRSARHAPGHEHRARRFADHNSRELAPRRRLPSGNDDQHGGNRHSAQGAASPVRRRPSTSIIQANRLQGGPRKVTHITEVLNMEQDTVIMQDIFLFVQDGIDETGRAFGHFTSTGVRPAFMGRLESAGVRLPANLFAARKLGR